MHRLFLFWLLFLGFNAMAISCLAHIDFGDHTSTITTHNQGFQKTQNQNRGKSANNHSIISNPLAFIVTGEIRELGGVAHLEWSTPGAVADGFYYVERMDVNAAPPVAWVEIKKLPFTVLQYDDTISFPYCTKTDFSYRIRCESTLTGILLSDNETANLELFDNTDPADVKDVLVSISKLTGNPVISWTPASDDILRYIFQRYNRVLPYIAFDSIAAGTDTYNDQIDGCNKSYSYVVRARDKCNRSSAPVYDTISQRTIIPYSNTPGPCERFASLTWNSYNGMPGGLGGYTIFRDDAMGESKKFDSQTTSYVDNSGFEKGHIYLYTVKAYSNNGIDTSSSCQLTWMFLADLAPDLYITQVSVEDDSFIRVGYQFTPPGTIFKLILERSDNGTDFLPVDSLVSSGTFTMPPNSYIDDTTADVHKQSYDYRLIEYDNCGGMAIMPTVSRSIFLQSTVEQNQNTLEWNSYETWNQDVESYKVYRAEAATVQEIAELQSPDLSFTDLLAGVDPAKEVCYWVVAKEFNTGAFSKSNIFCIPKEAELFMPNAFNPESARNKLLRPVPVPLFVDPQSFKMVVFSRWGLQIFETTDMAQGWDGTINGLIAPIGLYSYIISYKSQDGKEYTKRGTAMLIR